MARAQFWVHLVTHDDGRLSGRLLSADGSVEHPPTGYGESERDVFSQLALALQEKAEAISAFEWRSPLELRRVKVRVNPQTIVKRRHVIAKRAIEIRLAYVSSKLESGGTRVLVPRFGWWFIVEDIEMAAAVIRQAAATALLGENPRSIFDFRGVVDERIVSWSPTLDRRREIGAFKREESLPTLHAVAEDWTERRGHRPERPIVGDPGLERCWASFERDPPRSLVIVGPPSSGKTTFIRAVARRLGRGEGRTRRLWATSADRIVAGMAYLGQWEQRCLDLVAELAGEGDLLYLGELGPICAPRSGGTTIAEMLLPALAAGEISVIAECTPEELARTAARAPGFVGLLRPFEITPPSSSTMPRLLHEYQMRIGSARELEPEALRRLVQHLELFSRNVSFPGKGFRFLDWLEQEHVPEHTTEPKRRTLRASDVSEAFARSTGLPLELITDERITTRASIAARLREGVIGQDDACAVAARTLTRFKTGLCDPDRPIGSLFFVGPTGVGKTELAKQLARYMFGSPERMVRVDMSEYMLPGSAQRLLAVGSGATSLVERVRQHPLSLVLLDEIEKAHPEVFDLLLGLLGEGRLSDQSGRFVDFRMTLVVMTSNLGVRERDAAGFGGASDGSAPLITAVRRHFRPELFNRIDDIVAFGSLSRADLLRIVDLELVKAAARTGLERRGLRLVVDAATRERLAELGWHPTRGARPLARVVEERLMSPLAVRLAADPKLENCSIEVSLDEHTSTIIVR